VQGATSTRKALSVKIRRGLFSLSVNIRKLFEPKCPERLMVRERSESNQKESKDKYVESVYFRM